MKKFLLLCSLAWATGILWAQQLPNANFEDWSAPVFDGQPQPKDWNASNVKQSVVTVNFAHRENGRTGHCMMVQDQKVGAMGITKVSPGYFSLGKPWVYMSGLSASTATAGTEGGINFSYRPDTMSVWIKRTGDNVMREDFYLLYYSWTGTARSNSYMSESGCTSTERTNEESDIRQALDRNECGTSQKANQIAEGLWREKKEYANWTNIRVPIYYMSDEVPTMMNVIFSASNYPNFRATGGMYVGNTLYVDDVEMIYSSAIHKLYVGDKEWKGFDPNSSEEQTYSLGENATSIPAIEAYRGAGQLTNARGNKATFNGRKLTLKEMTIKQGEIDGAPTEIVVRSEDNKSNRTYKIRFVRAKSKNANLADIKINGESLPGFRGTINSYSFELPFGTTQAPVVEVVKAEDDQVVNITQANGLNGTATIQVTAADPSSKKTYTIKFSVAQLSDNTLKDILVNGESLAGFIPALTIYKVSLPLGTTTMPTIKGVSAYADGAQTINYTAPTKIDGGQYMISVTTPGKQTPTTYKLNFVLEASTYSKLKGLSMVAPVDPEKPAVTKDYLAGFDPDNLTYYVNLPLGFTKLPSISFVKGDSYQKDVEIQYGGLDGTTRVIVTAASGAQTVYKIVVATVKSDVSTLKNIFVDKKPLTGFSAKTLKYTYNLEVGTTKVPTITVEQGDKYQTVAIQYGGLNETTRVSVTAGDGSISVYQVLFTVAKSSNCALKDLQVNGQTIAEFNAEKLEYTYVLAKGQAVPTVTAVKAEAGQTVNERKVNAAPGDYRVMVIAENGEKRTYVIHFALNLSHNADLKAILLDDQAMPEFKASQDKYTITLPTGQSTIPEVNFTKGDNGQKVLVSENNNVYTLSVTAEDGTTVHTYTIEFIIQKSENAFLNNIFLDGVALQGFEKTQLEYHYMLTTAAIPAITVEKSDQGQQVSISVPVGEGTASILVAPESGATNTYSIHFKKQATDMALLEKILVNGKTIEGWSTTKTNYTVVYSEVLPTVTYEAKAGQKVYEMANKESMTLYVVAGDEKASYTIHFTQQLSDNVQLAEIQLNGQKIADWNPAQYNYVKTLAAGEAEPVISWVTKEEAQSVVFGRKDAHTYQLVVRAASGKTATYTVSLHPQQYTDATLEDILLDGQSVMSQFGGGTTYSGRQITEGALLPTITYKKKAGQTVLVSNTSAHSQEIMVVAENGNKNIYKIDYKVLAGNKVTLSGILLDGVALDDFKPETKTYTVLLNERTTVVPSITPVSDVVGQTYTIAYGRVNETTTIEVLAKDGKTKGTYSIEFKVRPLTNNKLATLKLSNGTNLLAENPSATEFTYEYDPAGGVIPTVEYTKGEEEQTIEYTLGRGGETWIKVIAQSNESTTYHVQFTKAVHSASNVLKSLKINGNNVTIEDEIRVALPYGTTEFGIVPEKNFDGQTIILYNGGVTQPSKIIVSANNAKVEDKVYTIIPTVEKFAKEGKLESLAFKGNPVPNFQPDVFNYVVNVTDKPIENDFVGKSYGDKKVTVTYVGDKEKQFTIQVEGGEKYSVCYFYENDKDPFDFTGTWVTAGSTGVKPSNAWTVPADKSTGYTYSIVGYKIPYTTGKEVSPYGEKGIMLSTMRQGALRASIPGMATLGEMALSLSSNGGSTSSITKNEKVGVQFRNTPEQLAFQYKPLNVKDISGWKIWLTMSDGSEYRESTFEGNYSKLNVLSNGVMKINYPTNPNVRLNATLNSCQTESTADMNGYSANQYSDLVLQNMHLVYSSVIKSATINGEAATVNNTDHTISVTVDQKNVKFPELRVEGEVHDQEQQITWGEEVLVEKNMVRTGNLRNYGEDHSYTDYKVLVNRPAVESTDISIKMGDQTYTGNKTVIKRTSPVDKLTDIEVVPGNIHQKIAVTHESDKVTIVVTPEVGQAMTYTVELVEPSDNDALISIVPDDKEVVSPAFDASHKDYTVTKMPTFKFTKRNIYQSVKMVNAADKTCFVVTAPDKTTTATYTFTLANKTTSGELINVTMDDKMIPAQARMEVTKMPKVVRFTRKDESDVVKQVISKNQIDWTVTGSSTHNYSIVNTTKTDDNAQLAGILLNGKNYEDFDPNGSSTTITTESMIDLQFVAADLAQTITMSLQQPTANRTPSLNEKTLMGKKMTFEVNVTSANNNVHKKYAFVVDAPKSSDASLQSIVIGTETLQVVADQTTYTHQLPISLPKLKEPIMPEVRYTTTDPQATVVIDPASRNQTFITVTSPDGTKPIQYEINVSSVKSSFAELDGIAVDGEPIANFAADRYFYSVQVEPGKTHEVVASSKDKYVSIKKEEQDGKMIITATAEDGAHSQRYMVDLYEVSKSNNVTLRDILVGGHSLKGFAPMNNAYSLDIEPTTTILPDIQAVPMVAGQKVTARKDGAWKVCVDVIAANGVDKNTYTLQFNRPMSSNADLKMIMIDGDSLKGFKPEEHVYLYNLPVGVEVVPEIYAQRGDNLQKQPILKTEGLTTKITTTAENGAQAIYTILFNRTYSAADTLLAIYADNQLIEGFKPRQFYYNLLLPVETVNFPEMTWQEVDKWQKITKKTLNETNQSIMYQIAVLAENGHKNVYTIAYQRDLWNINTVKNIYLDSKPLENFSANKYEYSWTLPTATTQLPNITWDTEEKYKQTFKVDTITTGHDRMYVLTVTAENGKSRTYTIHFPVKVSSDASLNAIKYGDQDLKGFDAEITNYTVALPTGTTNVPVVTYEKKGEGQNVEIAIKDWQVTLTVTAEDKVSKREYVINFEIAKSSNTTLKSIVYVLGDKRDTVDVVPMQYDYQWQLPLGVTTLPKIEVVKGDNAQEVSILDAQKMRDGGFLATIFVTAADGTPGEYRVTFSFAKNGDASLKELLLDKVLIKGFHADSLEYNYVHPSGTTKDKYFGIDRVHYTLSDPLAKDTIYRDDTYTIYIDVMAQDGSRNTYSIRQSVAKSEDNWLDDILLDGISIRGFVSRDTFYTYYIKEGSIAPEVTAVPHDDKATWSIKPTGDSTLIICTAEDNTDRIYVVHFAKSQINEAETAEASDVLVKHIKGSNQIIVATTRAGVAFGLYDREGHLVRYVTQEELKPCDPNDAIMMVNGNGQEFLSDIVGADSGVTLTLDQSTLYFYVFYDVNNKRRITSSKMAIMR